MYVVLLSSVDQAGQAASSTPRAVGSRWGLGIAFTLCASLFATEVWQNNTPVIASVSSNYARHDAEYPGVALYPAVAEPEHSEVANLARTLIDRISSTLPMPTISTNDDGEFGFSWAKGRDRLEAMLDPDKHLVWITKTENKFDVGGDILVRETADFDEFIRVVREFQERA